MGNTKNPLILYHSKTLTSSARFHFPVISAWFPSFLSAPLVPFSTDFHSISAPASSRKFPFSWRTYLNYQWMYILHNSSNKFVEPNEKLAVYKYKRLTANSTEKIYATTTSLQNFHITSLSFLPTAPYRQQRHSYHHHQFPSILPPFFTAHHTNYQHQHPLHMIMGKAWN